MNVPENLRSTYNLISKSFPGGIDNDSYLPLLSLLEEQMSDRNLAEIISLYSGKNYYGVLNDIYKVKADPSLIPNKKLNEIKNILVLNGYEEWLSEE